ncbi:hypothetical protein [Leptospira interrogans]|uniref:hypothetical protein n=1 Tax=Leptospira interrogans TaxID=173 RepID=UPI0007738F20|nr:hypothetical protein [Leptospira interrogans]
MEDEIETQNNYALCTNSECLTTFSYTSKPPIYCNSCSALTISGCFYCGELFSYAPKPVCSSCSVNFKESIEEILVLFIARHTKRLSSDERFPELPEQQRKLLLEKDREYIPFLQYRIDDILELDELERILRQNGESVYAEKIVKLLQNFGVVLAKMSKKFHKPNLN